MNRIVQVDNFQNMACCCENWLEFTQELEEWGVTGCAKIEFDDPDLDIAKLDRFKRFIALVSLDAFAAVVLAVLIERLHTAFD